MILNICLALLGNAFIIFAYGRNFKMRTVTNTLVVNLCVSDALSALADAPFWLAVLTKDPLYGHFLACRAVLSLEDLFLIVALLNMCGIALDRFVTLVKGHRRRVTRQRARVIVVWSWLQAFVAAVPWCLVSDTCGPRCLPVFPHIFEPTITPRVINVAFKIVNVVVPLCTIYYVFLRILNSVRSSRKVSIEDSYISRNSSAEKFAVDAYRRSSKTAVILFTMFSFCSLPYLGVVFYTIITGERLENFRTGFTVYFIFSLKRSLFPAIYIFRNRLILNYLQETFRCGVCGDSSKSKGRDSFIYTANNSSSCFMLFGKNPWRGQIHPSVYDGDQQHFPKHLEFYFVGNNVKETKPIIEDQFVNIAAVERKEIEGELVSN